jgi:hypothetical protein
MQSQPGSNQDWVAAYRWIQNEVKVLTKEQPETKEYYFASTESVKQGVSINKTKLNAYIKAIGSKSKFDNFDDYNNKTTQFWTVVLPDLPGSNCRNGTCNCPYFGKFY